MNELIENVEPVIKSFPELKNATDKAMAQAVENFVLIGYLLRKAKDEPELLSGSGYCDYKEFAKREYGLEESQVSRFISINERYGDGAQLRPQFRGYGQSKLAEMLTLPAAVAEELPPEITRQEIREIKKEIAEENKISDLELHVERAEHPNVDIWREFLKDWMHRNPQKYLEIDIDDEYETILMNCALTARVLGEGKFIMTEKNREITLTNLRTSEKHILLKEEVEDIIDEINNSNLFTVAAWQEIFGEEFPRIAPAQEPSDKENKPKSEEKAAETTENKEIEEAETVADKENKPNEEIPHETITPAQEDILPDPTSNAEILKAAADEAKEEAYKYVEAGQKITEELNKGNSKTLEEMVDAQAEEDQEAAVEDIADDEHEPTPIEVELAECINILDGWKKELCKPDLTSRGVRELKDSMVPLTAQAMERLASALWDAEVQKADEEDE